MNGKKGRFESPGWLKDLTEDRVKGLAGIGKHNSSEIKITKLYGLSVFSN
jgi:hypothetical protein